MCQSNDDVAGLVHLLGCIDPSEPFQCPRSQRCIALQFICDGHPGDCPGNFDENEETCIAGRYCPCLLIVFDHLTNMKQYRSVYSS
jgi:hypothetical protein